MLTRLLTILPLLLCPLLMLACMWAMRNREPPRQAHAGQEELLTAARVAQLERELADLRARFPEADTAGEPASASALDPTRGAQRHAGAAGLTNRR
jgi:hypothetical protein